MFPKTLVMIIKARFFLMNKISSVNSINPYYE